MHTTRRRRPNPYQYPKVTTRTYRGVQINRTEGQPYAVAWNGIPEYFVTLKAAKAYIDQRRGDSRSAYDEPPRRRNPDRYRHLGYTIVRSGARAWRIVGIAKQDRYDNDYLLFSTAKSARQWLDRHAGDARYTGAARTLDPRCRNPSRRKPPPSHDLFGEREHKVGLFGDTRYAAVPKPKRSAPKRRGKAPSRQQGALAFAAGLFD